MMEDRNDDDSLVIPEQSEIRVYTNPSDAVVISQTDAQAEDGHSFVYVHRHHLPALIKKLQTYLPGGGA